MRRVGGSRRTALWNDQLLFRVDCPHLGRVLAGIRWCCAAMGLRYRILVTFGVECAPRLWNDLG